MSPRRLALALLLPACGPEHAVSEATTGTTAVDVTGTTDNPTTGGAHVPVLCPASAESIDPFPEPAACEDYRSVGSTTDLEIGLVNLRSEAVFIHAHVTGAKARVELSGKPGDRSVRAEYECDVYTPLCSAILDNSDGGCPLIGKEYGTIRIEPGVRYRLQWRAQVVFPVTLPDECQPNPVGDRTCTTIRPIPPGAYTLAIEYSTECTGECTCEPEPEGGCKLSGTRDFPAEHLTARASYDGICDVVDIVIE